MWGDGSSDEGTIPSWFAKINNTNVANFGEAGYSARQSLNLLLTLISEGNRPRGIIFFEGSNDVGYQCLRENSFLPAHGRSDLFRDQVSQSLRSKITGKVFYLANNYRDNLFNSYRRLLGLKESTDRATALLTLYDCHSNSEKARRVAQHIFNDWKMAYLLANDLGVPFRAILQPTVFSSKDQERHIKYRDFYNVHSMNISAVYPIVNELMEKYCADTNKTCSNAFIDGRHWINTDKPIFFDHIHVNSEGNRIIAEQIANALER